MKIRYYCEYCGELFNEDEADVREICIASRYVDDYYTDLVTACPNCGNYDDLTEDYSEDEEEAIDE